MAVMLEPELCAGSIMVVIPEPVVCVGSIIAPMLGASFIIALRGVLCIDFLIL